uniref:Synapse defective Rho GTPase homolog 2 n=1 Tax=Erpetoichthys calabaricus TaxID=27687 RepID=A0A8C4SE53_ERPCA
MADPLRRTLLAKLRGKKSKTATAAVGFGVASNCDNREGKEKVFQQVAEEQSSTEVATSASRGKTKGSEGNTERKISVVRSDRVIVAGSTSAPCETFVQVNSLEMLSDQNADEFRGRDNEQLVGGPLQRATLQKMSERDMMSRFNEHDPRFISPTRPASFGRSDAHRHAFIPRQYTGDSIGFGIYENHGLNGDNAFGHTGHACWRDAQYFVSKNNMINIASRNGVVGGSGFSSHIDYRMIETRETGVRVDLNSTTETGRSVSRDSAQDGSLLMLSQSCGNGLTYSRSYGDSFQGPAYFPTDLTCVSYQTLNGFEANLREGMQRHNSIDSEDEDYYDNYECDTNGLQMVADPAKESPFPRLVSCEIANSLGKNSAQETDRLRTQLQEAYYLLINAMHDIGTDNQAGSTVFADQVSTSSCHSEDSVCTQSSAKALETDGCPASETPEQATLIAAPLVSRIVCETGFSKSSDVRKSTGDITMVRYTAGLHRSLSDGDVRLAADHTGSPRLVNIGTYNKECKLHIQEVPNGHILAGHYGKDSVATVNNFSGFSEVVEHEGSKTEGCAGESGPVKPPGVTVNKMQEWMHKGRLLSSEMKQRITGSTHRSVGVSEPSARKDDTAKKSALAACPRTATVPPDGTEASSVGFSPPSSPSPIKKGTSINWSFPDKIKSPRTVRKLSMKMKKLPELSRKLSVKGVSSNTSHSESQATSPKSNGTSSGMESGQSSSLTPGCSTAAAASRNVISRYHLDSSVNTQHSYKKNSSGGSKSASKGGYLSDGDSPELVTKSGKHHGENKNSKGKEPAINNSKGHGTDIDVDAFRHYSFADQPKSSQYISGLMSVHFYGAEDLKPPRIDSRDVYCAIQVDSVNKARTALLTCRTTFLDMDHTFNIELENAQHLKLVVFSWEPTPRRNKVCCHGTVVLPSLFRVTKTHQLAVKLEPRGIIYVKLNLMEQWENSLDSPDSDREPIVFGVEAWKVVEKENSGLMVPLLIDKCIREIEKRGCQVVGLYRLCGSAAVKKELREAFERDSKAVEVSENQYPDINVITGVLKDYLRELPYPLITKQLYEAVLEAMAKRPLRIGANGCENDASDSEYTVSLLEHLPDIEKATLKMLLNHLKLVASYHEVNKMTCQNLAVCFGPVLLSQRQEASSHSHRVFIDSEELASALDFKKHIEVLHYLLQLWPVMGSHTKELKLNDDTEKHLGNTNYLRRKPQQSRPQVLHLNNMDIAGVLRPRQGRLDSPSNRYAGDWSACGDSYFSSTAMNSGGEADYDDVPSEDTESDEEMTFEEVEGRSKTEGPENHIHTNPKQISKEHTYQAYMEIQDIGPSLCHQVNLRDLQESIDTLIGNLERELNKNKLNAGFKASNGLKQENPF